MHVEPINEEAFHLMLEGAVALAKVEHEGIAVDVPHLRTQDTLLADEITVLRKRINNSKEAQLGRAVIGHKWDPGNNHHVAQALRSAGYTLPQTEKGNDRTDAESLLAVGGAFTVDLSRLRKLEKLRGTYIAQWLREVGDDGYMHPVFNLHTVKTYRSSSDNPNFQNIPRRDEEARTILRRAIIPSAGNRLVEVDYGAMEVRIIACYTKDPVLCEYIESGNDMHRDVASWDFGLPQEEITKGIRDIAKNGGTFPRFYGSWWKSIAQNYWKRIVTEDPLTTSGKSLRKHVKSLANMEVLAEAGEKRFWKQFQASRDWQDDWVAKYQSRGWFEMLTGHRCSGIMGRNELYNWPVQGTAFLCLLWSLIQSVKHLDAARLETRLIGQIHDSKLFDTVPEEQSALLPVVERIMTKDIRKHWPWVCVPLLAEFEASGVDGNWSEKKKLEV